MTQAERVLDRVEARSNFAEQLRSQLRLSFRNVPAMTAIARGMSLSERSLRRRLAEQGVSYSQLLRQAQWRRICSSVLAATHANILAKYSALSPGI